MDALKQLQDACLALEYEAGISKAMERAREGRFIPLGAMGEDASPSEYFADEHDHFRGKARDAYFSVQDLEFRKRLIAAQRKIEGHIMRSLEAEIAVANHAVLIATAKTHKQPWTKAAVFALGTVAVGYWVFGVVGAIAGAAGGFFLGQRVISDATSEAIAEVNQAIEKRESVRMELVQRSLWPECFSNSEELFGEREEQLDRESAYTNVLQTGNGR